MVETLCLTRVLQDAPGLIKYPSRHLSTIPPHHRRTYRLATWVTIPLIFFILLFWLITHGSSSLVVKWELLPQFYLFLLVFLFIIPFQRLSRTGRYWFLSTLRRVSIGRIAEAQDGKFGDLLLADVLTSYAKVLGDLFVSECMFVSFGSSSTDRPDRSCGGQYMVPIIISIPSMIRLRQCLIEYWRARNSSQKSATGWGGQHLANALKYSSAFPVIILSALQRGYDPNKIGMSETGLFRLWYEIVHIVLEKFTDTSSQAVLHLPQLFLLILLGRGQGLGPHALLLFGRAQQSGTPLGSPATHPFPRQGNVLRCHFYRSYVALYMEFQAVAASGSLQ